MQPCCLSSIIGIIKQAEQDGRGKGHRGEKKNAYKFSTGGPEGKVPLKKYKLECESNIKMDLKEIWCEGAGWIKVPQIR